MSWSLTIDNLVDCAATELKVQMSSNVFGEDLHNTRHLETTYYVTDTTQAYDFYWDRESGLRVNIGILDVHLIPEYEDVDHAADGDNEFMMANPHDSDEKIRFQRVIRNYCRSLPRQAGFRPGLWGIGTADLGPFQPGL